MLTGSFWQWLNFRVCRFTEREILMRQPCDNFDPREFLRRTDRDLWNSAPTILDDFDGRFSPMFRRRSPEQVADRGDGGAAFAHHTTDIAGIELQSEDGFACDHFFIDGQILAVLDEVRQHVTEETFHGTLVIAPLRHGKRKVRNAFTSALCVDIFRGQRRRPRRLRMGTKLCRMGTKRRGRRFYRLLQASTSFLSRNDAAAALEKSGRTGGTPVFRLQRPF